MQLIYTVKNSQNHDFYHVCKNIFWALKLFIIRYLNQILNIILAKKQQFLSKKNAQNCLIAINTYIIINTYSIVFIPLSSLFCYKYLKDKKKEKEFKNFISSLKITQ